MSGQGSTTPNSSVSNMACLPEDRLSNNVSGSTPSPPPPLTTIADPPMLSTTAIYARVNPHLKRDKTNVNNNFTSTFAPLQQQSAAINSSSNSSSSSSNDHRLLGKQSPMGPWIQLFQVQHFVQNLLHFYQRSELVTLLAFFSEKQESRRTEKSAAFEIWPSLALLQIWKRLL